jgi:uncharacterized protein (DUF1684 family)
MWSQSTPESYNDYIEKFRATYKAGFTHDERSPLNEEDLIYLDFYPPNKTWKLNCQCVTDPNNTTVEMPTYSGQIKMYKIYGEALCHIHNDTFSLKLYQNVPNRNPLHAQYLFLPFKDHTNGDTTYGGGRYINLNIRDIQDGQIIIDFNTSYNPWCAYSDGYNCPIPPRDNHISMAIEAGEKNYRGNYKSKDP